MLAIRGTIVTGAGAATGTLAKQIPLIETEFPEISRVHRGSINVRVDRPIRVINPDHRTRPIAWDDVDPCPEQFDLLRIYFECPIGDQRHNAWLYIPHRFVLMRHPFVVEIISEFIPNAQTGSSCFIHLRKDHLEALFVMVI